MPDHSQPLRTRSPEVLFGILVFLSGMAALGHQLLWTRRLIDLLGASAESSARVFGTFFLGLSVGSAIAALLVGRIRNPLRVAGVVQLCIPVLVIPVIYLSRLTDWIWPVIGAQSMHGWSGGAIKSLLTLGFVFPPSAMMGLSFPLIVSGVLRLSGGALGRSGIKLYAINTLGGASGVLFTVMVALPRFGNFASMALAAAVDGTIGVALLLYARTCDVPRPSRVEPAAKQQTAAPSRPFIDSIALAFLSGTAVLALEVTAFQMFQLVATVSLFSPAAVLFCAITSLGTAAAVFARYESALVSNAKQWTLVLLLSACGILVALVPQIFMGIAERSNWFAENDGVSDFVLKLGALALLSVGPAWLVAGLIFPFAVARAGQNCSPTQSGQRLGLLLAVNGIGGLLGAELAYRVLLPALGIYGAISVIALALTATALVVAVCSSRSAVSHLGHLRLVASSALVVVMLTWLANLGLPAVKAHRGITSIDVQSGREGTVAVLEDQRGDRTILVGNQYVLGGTSVRYDQERQLLLPLVIHPNPLKVGCIGMATGITPGAALSMPSVEVTAIEISPLVARAADVYFRDFNHDLCRSEDASVVIGDGRTYIASLTDEFDLITGDLFLPWAPGTARLYSREHFASVRRALKPGGVFCQWLPMYQLTPEQFELIANTFASEFGETHLFMNHFRVAAPMLALVGGKQPGLLDWQQVQQRCDRLRESNTLIDPVLRHESGLRMLYLGPWQSESGETQLVSLADPSLEYSAATVRLSGDPAKKYFNPSNWVRFCRSRQQGAAGDSNAESSIGRQLMMLGTGLLELDYARRTKNELADAIASRVSLTMPRCLVNDRSADWERWPGPSVNREER